MSRTHGCLRPWGEVHRLGYVAVDGTPRNAPKLAAQRRNPTVALKIDDVDGIPEEFLTMNGTHAMTPEQRTGWEAEVRSLYEGMVRVVVTPTCAELIDVETTLPSAVEELYRRREEQRRP